MLPSDPQRSFTIRAALHDHLVRRLNEALAKIHGTDTKAVSDRRKQQEFYQLQPLLNSGADCVSQIQMATHIVKGIHPDPKVKEATNLLVDPSNLPDLPLVGSHVLSAHIDIDATGNGAFNKKIHEVFLLLQTKFEDECILNLLKRGDSDAIAALGGSPEEATSIADRLTEMDAARCMGLASHTQAKQIYWPVGADPHDNSGYHLLAPLYPTSLVHRVYQTLQEDRFSEAAKAARKARKAGEWHERPVREYPNLAVQKLGGGKPRNISQLNHIRDGNNYLLASLPPVWQSLTVKPLFGVESLFDVYRWRREVRTLARELRRFLEGNPASNLKTRQRLDELVNALLDELIQFTAEVRTLDAGWSRDPQCSLPPSHGAWLDPDAADVRPDDVIERLSSDFAHWLNAQLREPLPMGDPEYLYWFKLAREQIKDYEGEVLHEQ
ncbi:type I-F CRISPR-associated protein Csy1 [Thiocapsa imhoffii]|uniref:Type I-F CRISPR-associated protein Csy1 n=1 Tax=Thiocapsa imhoffii TaxID=382777 RepID=A0A9X0WLB9_9GAMM|nr:type I-F CRISPR-associated protein Csy1 [Thiocapsa imhoffii]MBK1646693.1 type I-F CRISPR-associated protein Csy1 [Thiocapsa imhoffii]